MKAPCGSAVGSVVGHLVGRLVLLRGGEDQRRIVFPLRGRRPRLAVGEQVGILCDVARVEGQSALFIPGPNAAAESAAVATVEDHREVDALVQRSVEDAGHLAVADVVASEIGVGRHKGAVRMNQLAAHGDGELGALAVDAQRPVTGVVEDHRVARLRQVDQVPLHGSQNAVARGLRSRQQHESRPRTRRSRVGEENHIASRKAELRAGEQVGHGLRIVDRTVEILKISELAAAIGAAWRMLGLGAWRLVHIDADEQGAPGLRRCPCPAENAQRSEECGKTRLHTRPKGNCERV